MEVLFVYTFLAFLCCIPEIPQATSGMPTKYYFLIGIKSFVIFYGLYFVVTRTKISRSVFKNGWIYLMSFIFFLADRALFVANQNPASKVTVMTLIKQPPALSQ